MNGGFMAMMHKTKDQSSQWKLPDSLKEWQSRSKSKTVLTVLFDWEGVVHHEYSPLGQTINKECCLSVLHQLRDAIQRKRPQI